MLTRGFHDNRLSAKAWQQLLQQQQHAATLFRAVSADDE